MLDFSQFTTQDWIAVGSPRGFGTDADLQHRPRGRRYREDEQEVCSGRTPGKGSLGPSRAMRKKIDIGAYDGEYEVASRPPDRVYPKVLELWHAVTAKWPVGEVVWFEDIVDRVESDAPDALRDGPYMDVIGPDADMRAALLVNNDLFNPISGGLAS